MSLMQERRWAQLHELEMPPKGTGSVSAMRCFREAVANGDVKLAIAALDLSGEVDPTYCACLAMHSPLVRSALVVELLHRGAEARKLQKDERIAEKFLRRQREGIGRGIEEEDALNAIERAAGQAPDS